MKKLLVLLLASAALLAGCEKDDPTPKWKPLPPFVLDDGLYYYLENGQKEYFVRRRKDRVIIKTASLDHAQALSGLLRPSIYIGEWVAAAIDANEMDLRDVLMLQGALDATYGFEYIDGTLQYTMDDIFIETKPGFTPQEVLKKVGLLEYATNIELDSDYHDIYLITFNLRSEEIMRICRVLYEAGQCTFAEPNFFVVKE